VDAEVIEVGVAIYDRHETIQTWSSLVRPSPHCRWDEQAAAVHNIARADLQDAPEPRFVAGELNKVMDGVAAAHCDGYKYDAAWMNNLYRNAEITPSFELNPLEEMPRTHMRIVRMNMGAYLERR
jgi:DNA polymerase III epsilon subunit-like protein